MAFDMDIFDAHILLSAYLGEYHRRLTSLYLPSSLNVPPIVISIPPGSGKTYLARKYGFTDIDDWFGPAELAARAAKDWNSLNSLLTAQYAIKQPQVLLLHHPAQVSARKAIVIATPYLGPPDPDRLAGHASLKSLSPDFTATTHVGVERLVLRLIKQHTLRSLAPLFVPPTARISTVNPPSYCFFNVLHALTLTDIASDYWAMRVHDVPRPHALRTFQLLNVPILDIRSNYSSELLSKLINRNPHFTGAILFMDHVVGRAYKVPPTITPLSYNSSSKSHSR
jgi:hypothetical protein